MARYTDEFKNRAILEMMPPINKSLDEISRSTGIPIATLTSWRRKARDSGIPVPSGEKQAERWSAQDKFHIVLETITMTEIEMAEYCRSKGLYVEEVLAWKDACVHANGGVAKQLTDIQRDLKIKEKENKKLLKELQRKDAALAETAALLVLRKKASAIWGESEED